MDKLEKLQHKCRTDLKFLTVNVLGLSRWSDELHGGLAEFLDAPGDRKGILLPRGHQKTTIASTIWPIQQLLKNPNESIAIYSATWGLSKDILKHIKTILVQSPLKDIFGDFYNRECLWTNEEIDIAQKNGLLSKNPSIRTGGVDTSKTGTHCSLMIMDDIVTPETTTTPEQMKKTIEAYKACLPLLDAGGRLVIVGTRYAQGDVYGHLLDKESRSINGKEIESEEARKKWRDLLTY